MCWMTGGFADSITLFVSVAGCLGYDVLDAIGSSARSAYRFQLLVV